MKKITIYLLIGCLFSITSVDAQILCKDFEDNCLTNGGWTEYSVVGDDQNWYVDDFGGDVFAKMSGYSSGSNNQNEDWLLLRLLISISHS